MLCLDALHEVHSAAPEVLLTVAPVCEWVAIPVIDIRQWFEEAAGHSTEEETAHSKEWGEHLTSHTPHSTDNAVQAQQTPTCSYFTTRPPAVNAVSQRLATSARCI